ncbi:hypothetical protein ACFSJ3_05705 [Corallincola platygyrae]|uniref:YbbD head domain-containing protein n=1 Tax=Corallincola platygyrae TaxID=1193278 RepID=A0ABW4XL04_9GAMM
MAITLLGERPKSEFDTYKEAEAAGMMQAGWIPPFIPHSSFNIKEQHDIDTNIVTMSFEYRPDDTESTREACSSEKKIDKGIEFDCPHLSSNVTITLLNNGTGTLHSSVD